MLDHYRGHESNPMAAYLRELELRTGGGANETIVKADDPLANLDRLLANADDLLAKIAAMAGPARRPEPEREEALLDPLARAAAAVESLQKAVADCQESFAETDAKYARFLASELPTGRPENLRSAESAQARCEQ
jgi:hypothetical protein